MEERFKVALAQAVEHVSSDPQTRAILVFGSVSRGEPHARSDIDMYALTTREAFWRTYKYFNGVQCETIYGPQKEFERVLLSRDMISVRSFALGTTLLDLDGVMPRLTAIAKKVHAEGPAPISPKLRTKYRTILTRHLHKLEGLPEDSIAARLVANDAIHNVLFAFYHYHRLWMNNLGTRLQPVEERDPRMGQLLKDFYLGGQKPQPAIAASSIMLELLGGPLEEYVSDVVPLRKQSTQPTEEAPE